MSTDNPNVDLEALPSRCQECWDVLPCRCGQAIVCAVCDEEAGACSCPEPGTHNVPMPASAEVWRRADHDHYAHQRERWPDGEDTLPQYISHAVLCVGDYGGAGSVGAANILSLEDTEGAWIQHHAYSSQQLWLPDTDENREVVRALENYPLIDDEEHSTVESEWESDAWQSYGKSDLISLMPEPLKSILTYTDYLTDDTLFNLYREAMDNTNSYPVMEYSGAHLPLERIAPTFADIVAQALVEGWANYYHHALPGYPVPEHAEEDEASRIALLVLADRLLDEGKDEEADLVRQVATNEGE